MSAPHLTGAPVLVVGAGIMGTGIAQVAAQAGHAVYLHDARPGAAVSARDQLGATLDKLAAKGKLTAEEAQAVLGRVRPVTSVAEAADAKLVVEAIVEQLDVKRSLFRELESVLGDDVVLATNTSSISVTAIANGLRRPQRLVGMHFFNPVPLMKLVEVVSGLQTDRAVAEAVQTLAGQWGKTAVHARSTPGFIVNRIARPFYAEALALLQEQAATPAVIDDCLRGAGFRMGPCELMDLIGHDTNFAVTMSVFDANFQDRRFQPSMVQKELVDGGLLGRKSGQGFYRYPRDDAAAPTDNVPALPDARGLTLHGDGVAVRQWVAALDAAGRAYTRDAEASWAGLSAEGPQGSRWQLRLTDGRTAADVAADERQRDLVLHDLSLRAEAPAQAGHGPAASKDAALAFVAAPQAHADAVAAAGVWLAALGWRPVQVADAAGLVVARTLAMLINEAADAVQQGVCDEAGADAAMKLGVNYPAGPFEWLAAWDAKAVAGVLRHLDDVYRGDRYRVSPWLRRRAAGGR